MQLLSDDDIYCLKSEHVFSAVWNIMSAFALCTHTYILSGMVDPTVSTREYWMIYRGAGLLGSGLPDSAPRPPPCPSLPSASFSLSVFLSVAGPSYWRGVGEGSWWAWSQIIRPRESLALYKSFSTVWLELNMCRHIGGNSYCKLCCVITAEGPPGKDTEQVGNNV